MDEYIKSIKAHLYDRATSPLFGTFVASWIIWNYKFILILFSSMEPTAKLSYIETALYGSNWDRFGSGLIFPLTTALLFIFIYPVAANPIYRYVRQRQKDIQEIKRKIDEETVLTVKESRAIRRTLLEQEQEFNQTLRERDALIDEFKKVIADFENGTGQPSGHESTNLLDHTNPPADKNIQNIGEPLDRRQFEMLRFIANNPDSTERHAFVATEEDESVEPYIFEYDFGLLRQKGMIEQTGMDVNTKKPAFSATQRGREFLINATRNPEIFNINLP